MTRRLNYLLAGCSVLAAAALSACGGEGGAPVGGEAGVEAAGAPAAAQEASGASAMAAPPIDEAVLRQRIATLAGDEFEGRAPASEGGARTRAFLVEEMKRIGLKPAVGDSYEQVVPLLESTLRPEASSFTIGARTFEYGSEAVYWSKCVEDAVSFADSDVVFVGYGVVAPEFGWNDYAGVDARGKTVVMLVNDPGFATKDPELFNGAAMTYYGRWTYKFEEAARQGATAAIIVHQTEPAAYGWGVVEGSWTGPQIDLVRRDLGASRAVLEGWVQEDEVRAMFAEAGQDFDALAAAASTREFAPTPLGLKASARISNTIRLSESANVAGVLEGAEASDEYVLYTAHWDHLGANAAGDDAISNGAVDNATGTAGILSIAESMAAMPERPRRSVLFLAVTAEESGLLGSAYFAEEPFVPLRNVVGGINIDGVQPTPATKNLVVTGYGASELEEILKEQASRRGLYISPDPEPEKGYFYRSDHISIAKKGVPMLYADLGPDFVEGGEAAGEAFGADYRDNRYHKPSDEYDPSWDLRAMTDLFEIARDVGIELAVGDEWPTWYEGNEFRALRDAQRAAAE